MRAAALPACSGGYHRQRTAGRRAGAALRNRASGGDPQRTAAAGHHRPDRATRRACWYLTAALSWDTHWSETARHRRCTASDGATVRSGTDSSHTAGPDFGAGTGRVVATGPSARAHRTSRPFAPRLRTNGTDGCGDRRTRGSGSGFSSTPGWQLPTRDIQQGLRISDGWAGGLRNRCARKSRHPR